LKSNLITALALAATTLLTAASSQARPSAIIMNGSAPETNHLLSEQLYQPLPDDGCRLSFTVFFMHSFFGTLPTTVAEAALVDGASHTTTFFRVMLPMAKPGLISIGIFNILGQWNQWYLPTLLMQDPTGSGNKREVIAQGLIDLSVNQGYKSDWSGLFAGVTMAMLPVLIVYIVFQRQVQAGLTGGITK